MTVVEKGKKEKKKVLLGGTKPAYYRAEACQIKRRWLVRRGWTFHAKGIGVKTLKLEAGVAQRLRKTASVYKKW